MRRSLVCPTRPARGGWLAVVASRGRLAGRRPRSRQGGGSERNETEQNHQENRFPSRLVLDDGESFARLPCWTFFFLGRCLYISLYQSHQIDGPVTMRSIGASRTTRNVHVFGECRSLPTVNCRSPPAPCHPSSAPLVTDHDAKARPGRRPPTQWNNRCIIPRLYQATFASSPFFPDIEFNSQPENISISSNGPEQVPLLAVVPLVARWRVSGGMLKNVEAARPEMLTGGHLMIHRIPS